MVGQTISNIKIEEQESCVIETTTGKKFIISLISDGYEYPHIELHYYEDEEL
jgi:hypothetical protein